jgi:hypothetical protein
MYDWPFLDKKTFCSYGAIGFEEPVFYKHVVPNGTGLNATQQSDRQNLDRL